MKAYRKFKLPEAAGPPAKVANSAKVLGPEPETLATLATLAAGDAQTTNFDGQLKDCSARTCERNRLSGHARHHARANREKPSRSVFESPKARMKATASVAISSMVSGVVPLEPPTPRLLKAMMRCFWARLSIVLGSQSSRTAVRW
jgi:hypothetical protein